MFLFDVLIRFIYEAENKSIFDIEKKTENDMKKKNSMNLNEWIKQFTLKSRGQAPLPKRALFPHYSHVCRMK